MNSGSWHCTGDREQDYPQEKEMQKSKMAVWGGLANSCEKKRVSEWSHSVVSDSATMWTVAYQAPLSIEFSRKEEKWKAKEKREDIHLNSEFQRIARRDKKAFLSDKCKEIEENKRMGKTGALFKKIRYQGNISCKDGLDKGQKWYRPNRSRRY